VASYGDLGYGVPICKTPRYGQSAAKGQ